MSTGMIEKRTYQVVAVDKIATPDGMSGNNWHRYLIQRGNSEIVGQKPGTLKSVTEHAESVAETLNLRASGVNTTYAARKKK